MFTTPAWGAGLAKTCSDKQVIVMPVGTRADVLSHELGHALGLDHPVRPDITNVMQPGAGLDRCNLSLEQILKIQAALPSGSDTSKACPPGSPDCQLAMLRSDDAPCPQATAATVLDWIRCSHCPVDRRPFELASDPDALMEIVPDIRKFLVGTLRIEERLKVEMLADAAAADAATLGLKVNEGTGDAYRKLLLERYQIRAAAGLSALGRDPLPPHRTAPRDETFKVTALQTAIDSLAWALGLTAPEKEDPPAWGPISEPTVAVIACQHLNILLNTQARRTGQDPKPVPCAAESPQLPAAK